MYNDKKVKRVQKIILAVLFIAGIFTGFAVGQLVTQHQEKNEAKQTVKVKEPIKEKAKTKELTSDEVNNFLIAYYTKKDLSENRKRYKPFMTSSMYTQETDIENLPINQAYKGYVINQVFDEANIYIDTKNSIALVEVKYHNTQLVDKGTTDGALVDTPETQTLKLTFTNDNGKFKVNNINKIFLTTTNETPRSNTYEDDKEDAEDDPTQESDSKETKDSKVAETSSSEETKTTDSTISSSTENSEAE